MVRQTSTLEQIRFDPEILHRSVPCCVELKRKCRYRSLVRSLGFQPKEEGSIPSSDTKFGFAVYWCNRLPVEQGRGGFDFLQSRNIDAYTLSLITSRKVNLVHQSSILWASTTFKYSSMVEQRSDTSKAVGSNPAT